MHTVKVGVAGCGQISGIYLQNCTRVFDILDVVAVADLVPELAQRRADEYHIPHVCTVEELLAHLDIEIILDLTSPQAHAAVNQQALRAGKHVYTEKPFALTAVDADEVLELAQARQLRIGCAPDTFLGAGLQTCRALIDDGAIGTPYAAGGLILMGNMYDGLHPRFESYLQLGWDPLFDMAPYYLTALVFLLGPVRRVTGSTGQVHREITITNPRSHRYGETVPVAAPMNTAATLDFESGAIASLQAAKESFGYTPRLEIYGTDGILYAPDPNTFGGPIRIRRRNGSVVDVPCTHGFSENSRGIGVADMAQAMRSGRAHRANGELARHVLDITLGIFEAS
ncbi:MAG TPA: Gfo/Idh/MocA family oxidoreductase, partial [Herpetosiphonaceae bacterium]|nr:Gfo/Idh/MocA family oxidoreductase [Herpetosiphonaceae bacterium]